MIQLTQEESALIVDALNGIMLQIPAESILWQEIEAAVASDRLDMKWKVDGAALVEKLKTASREDAARVIELAHKFWGEQANAPSIFGHVRKIGLANALAPGDKWITATAAAKISGKSIQHLSQLAARGKLSVYPDAAEPNPQKRNRYALSEIKAIKKPRSSRRSEPDAQA